MITQLELSDNKFGGAELKNLPAYESLREIRLANTKIESIEDLQCLNKYKNLEILEVEECPITKKPNYRQKIFEILPQLIYLDSLTVDGKPYHNGNFLNFYKKDFLFRLLNYKFLLIKNT